VLICDDAVMAIPSRKLGHCNPDNEEADRRFDIGTLRHCESLVGLGEEEVEPQACRDGCDKSRSAIPIRSHADDHRDKNQRRGGIREARPERHEHGRYRNWQDQAGNRR
jgi:hypothetical protein